MLSAISPVIAGDIMQSKTLHVLLGSTGQAPYEETAPATILETFNSAVLGQLFWRDASFELKPGLIKDWRWDYQNNAYELTLRHDVYFHNGRHATAEDLEFSILRGFFTKYRSFYKLFLNNIDGLEEAENHKYFKSGAVRGVKITGPYTVQIKPKIPNPTFLYNFAFAYFSLVAKEALKPDYIHWKKAPVGAGPYKIVGQDLALGKFFLEKVKSNYSTAPQKIEIHTQKNAVVYDIIAFADRPQSKTVYTSAQATYPDGVWGIFFSNQNPLGLDPAFRKAIERGVNRDALVDGFPFYQPTYEILPSHFWGRTNVSNPLDLKKAKELFATLPKNLKSKTWPVPVFGEKVFSKDRDRLLNRLKSQFAEFGFKVDFYPDLEKFISKKTAIASPIKIAGRVADYVEPVVMFSSFAEGSLLKYEKPMPHDNRFEDLYTIATKAQTQEERLKSVRKLSSYFNEKIMAVPLLERKNVYYFNHGTVKTLGEQDEPLYLFLERVVMR